MDLRLLVALSVAILLPYVAAVPDLKAEYYTITSDEAPAYFPGEETTIQLALTVTNTGTDGLHSGDGSPKFYACAYFTDSVEEESADEMSRHFNLTIPDNQAGQAFPVSQKVNLTGLTVTVGVDKEHCFHYSHLCVQIMPTYSQVDPVENNDFCLSLGNVPPGSAGHLHCTDLVIKDLKMHHAEHTKFQAGQPTDISFSINVQNVGALDLPASEQPHFGFELFFEGAEAMQSLGSPTANRSLTTSAMNGKDNPTSASNVVHLSDVQHTVTMDVDDCKNFEEFCVRLVPSLEAKSYEDPDDNICVSFTETGAGTKDCSIDTVVTKKDPQTNTDTENGGAVLAISTMAFVLSTIMSVLF